ncbi:TrbG/VirB9 family P-type conjugative transfer protein, partial [Parasutterella sp.]
LLNQSDKEITDKTDSENRSEVNKFYSENFGSSPLSKEIAPLEVFDNGRFTYLKFDRHTDFPAVYRVSENEEETLLNSHIKGDWLVVHGVYRELRLRAGQAVVGIYNETYSGGGAPNDSGVSVPGLKRELVKEVN